MARIAIAVLFCVQALRAQAKSHNDYDYCNEEEVTITLTTTTTTTNGYISIDTCGQCDGCQSCHKDCVGAEEEHQGCIGDDECGLCHPIDCGFSAWGDWSAGDCNGLCGRERQIHKTNNQCGEPCVGPIRETKQCVPTCPHQDCKWADWSGWSACSCSCGGGLKSRDRGIAMNVVGAGATCEVSDMSEIAPCNTQSCLACVDAVWEDWSPWETCSSSCDGGVTWRDRGVASKNSPCGKPAIGLSRVTKTCNVGKTCSPDQDCEFADWGEWGACSCSCDGIQERTRRIGVAAAGDGTSCTGPTSEIAPCNVVPVGKPPPPNCPYCAKCMCPDCGKEPSPCMVADWSEWTSCSVTCGAGQHQRSRSVTTEPKNGGTPCDSSLMEVVPCMSDGATVCPKPPQPPGCLWEEWSEWSSCTRCAGERDRVRRIARLPKDGGAPCVQEASREVQTCNPPEHDCGIPLYCVWKEWEDWGVCSKTCGLGGTRKRERVLTTTKNLPSSPDATNLQEIISANRALLERVKRAEGKSVQETAVGFAVGFGAFVLAMFASRVFRFGSGGHDIARTPSME